MALGLRTLRDVSRTGNGKGCGWLLLGMAALLIGVLFFAAIAGTCAG